MLICLSIQEDMSEESLARFKIDRNTFDRMQRFFRNPEGFRNSYWYYFMDAMED
jgi:hypothetical protein